MKIAILSCRNFIYPGGAERLEIDMALSLNATIVCLNLDQNFKRIYPKANAVNFFTLNKNLPEEPFKQIFGMNLFRHLRLNFDFFIVMDDMALRFLKKPVPHIYYMHTPRRVFFDMYYPTLTSYSIFKKMYMIPILSIFRLLDQRFVKKYVKNIACNSHNTRNRIWKAYDREAMVIYPPVHCEQYSDQGDHGFWLSVNRVDKWKRIELQIETFKLLPDKKLLIAGRIYPEFKQIADNSPDNVIFLDSISDEELLSLYSQCTGFLTTAIDEDFGITPLEAMASGKPVVAVREGGYQETIVDGHTGLLVSPDPHELAEAIRNIDKDPSIFSDAARNRAEMFDYKIFKEKLVTYVHTCGNK